MKRAAPIVIAPKKDGTLHFCVKYCTPNAAAKQDSYPIPQMYDCIDSSGEAAIFTAFDASSEYCKVERDEADSDKAAFTSQHGLKQLIRRLIEIHNATGTSQRTVDVLL